MQNIRTIFFDIGDTLVYDDPPLIERVRWSLDRCELPYRESDLPAAFRNAEDYAMAQYLTGVPFDHPDVLAATSAIILEHLGIDSLDLSQLLLLRDTYLACEFKRVVHADAPVLLEELRRRGYRLGVISDWEETLPTLLQELDVSHHFDTVAVSALVGVTKPHPALFQAALDGMAVDGIPINPAEALHIGDYFELDVAGARSVGMKPLLFDWKQRTPGADCDRVTTFAALSATLLALPVLAA